MRVPIVASHDLELPDSDELWDVVRAAATLPDSRWDPRALSHPTGLGPTFQAARREGGIRVERGVARRVLRALIRAGYEPDITDQRVRARTHWPEYRGPELRPSQEKAIGRILTCREGVVVVPTGGGKTLALLYAASRTGQRTLIIPPRAHLAEQWEREARRFWDLADADVGRIYGGENRVGRIVTFGLAGSILPRVSELGSEFGFVAVDEAQSAGARTVFETVRHLPALYRIGTTADPARQDGGEVLVRAAIGSVIFKRDRTDGEREGSVVGVVTRIVPYDSPRILPRGVGARERALRVEEERLEVLDRVVGTAPPGILVLVRLVESARTLARRWGGLGSGLLLGRSNGRNARSEFERTRTGLASGELRIGVATWSAVGEGTDIPGLTSLVLATPPGRGARGFLPFNQNRGRVARAREGKDRGLVYLVWDRSRVPGVATMVAAWNDGRVEVARDATLQSWRPPRPGELL